MAKAFKDIKPYSQSANVTENSTEKPKFEDILPGSYNFTVDSNYINTFATESSNFLKKMDDIYSGGNYEDITADYSSEAYKLKQKSDNLRIYANSNKQKWDTQNYNNFVQSLNTFNKNLDTVMSAVKEQGQYIKENFSNSEEYINALNIAKQMQKYAGYSYDDMQRVIKSAENKNWYYVNHGIKNDELTEKIEWLKNFALTKSYNNSADYDEAIKDLNLEIERVKKEPFINIDKRKGANSKEVVAAADRVDELKSYKQALEYQQTLFYTSSMTTKADFYKYAKYDPKKAAGGDTVGLVAEFLFGKRNKIAKQQASEAGTPYNPGSKYDKYQYMSDDEKRVLLYLINKEGRKSAKKYLDRLDWGLNRRFNGEVLIPNAEKYADDQPFLAWAGTVLSSPFKTVGLVEDIYNTIIGQPIDVASPAHATANISSAIRTKQGEALGKSDALDGVLKKQVLGEELGTILYGAISSVGDMGYNLLLTKGLGFTGKGASKATKLLMSTNAAADGVIQAKNRGLSDIDAVLSGIAIGAAEWLTEKYSIEAFLGDPKNAITYILKNIVVNGVEEPAADVLNTVADVLIAGEKSEFVRMMKDREGQGDSQKEAFAYALTELLKQAGRDTIAGALSGSFMGGIGVTANRTSTNSGINSDPLIDWVQQTGREDAVDFLRQKGLDKNGIMSVEEIAKQKSVSIENISAYIEGNKTFNDVLDDYAILYADIVNSNRKWSWDKDIQGGVLVAQDQRKVIKQRAIEIGAIPKVEVRKVEGLRYGDADFASAGLVKKIWYLPEEMWHLTDREQFAWLDEQIGGRPEGYTWHHTLESGKMELVPYGIHFITSHNGGRTPKLWADAPR